jgi:hypothetical protein
MSARAVSAYRRADQGQRGTLLTVLGGIAGSTLGLWGGIETGRYMADHWGFDCCGDDPGQAAKVSGGLVFATAGTMLGTTPGTAMGGQRPPRGVRRVRDAVVGLGLGAATALGAAALTGGEDVPLVTFSLVQGLYAGLSNGRW